MINYRVKVPILFLIFNRPGPTKRVLDKIREVRPHQLFIAADGPRNGNEYESEQCSVVRKISTDIDWDCDVQTLFRENNLGCKYAVSSAINWFFSHVDRGIILEDDCLPENDFFIFCDNLLEKYDKVDQVMHISGTNLNWKNYTDKSSYYFSYHSPAWGWATWKRAWDKYDLHMSNFMNGGNKILKKRFADIRERIYLHCLFRLCYKNQIDTWDYQWLYALSNNNGLAIIPKVNMVTNIGVGSEATHTTDISNSLDVTAGGKLDFPLIDPKTITRNINADKSYFHHIIQKQTSLLSLIVRNIIPFKNQFIKMLLRKIGR
jgi:hypothetical protein